MAIELHCPGCGKHYALADTLAGKRARCKECRMEFEIPMASRPAARPAAPVRSTAAVHDDDEDGEEPAPRRAAPRSGKGKRRAPREIPGLITGLLGFLVLLVVGTTVLMGGMAIATGKPKPVEPLLILFGLFDLGVLSLVLCVVCSLKLYYVVAEDRAWWGSIMAMFGPAVLVLTTPRLWHEAKHLVLGYFAGVGGVILAIALAAFFGPAIKKKQHGMVGGPPVAVLRPGMRGPILVPGPIPGQGFPAPGQPFPNPGLGGPAGGPAAAGMPEFGAPAGAGVPGNPAGQPARALATPAAPEPPADADPITRALFGLKLKDVNRQKQAVRELGGITPADDRREEVQKALQPLLDHQDGFFVNDVISAMAAWVTPGTVPALIPRTSDSRFGVRWHAIEVLGKLHDARAAEAIAGRLQEDSIKAQPALRELGPAAEPALLPLLRSPDDDLRRMACEILRDVGGEETLTLMNKLPADPDLGVRMAAQQTMQAIAARVGPPKKAAGKSAKGAGKSRQGR